MLHTSVLYNRQVSGMSLGSHLTEQRTCQGRDASEVRAGHRQRGSRSTTLPCYVTVCDFVRCFSVCQTAVVVMVTRGCRVSKGKGACTNKDTSEARRGELRLSPRLLPESKPRKRRWRRRRSRRREVFRSGNTPTGMMSPKTPTSDSPSYCTACFQVCGRFQSLHGTSSWVEPERGI